MVDSSGEYVLQWEGHASHVTERFSGLLARQSLVDITLICQEQRLRVHKLVLASCSLYFEEMLEQDLGQEPTVLFSDINFEVLKSMVEFMYCGETNISKQHLEPLLQAAIVFKVKELASIVKNVIGAKNINTDETSDCLEEFCEENANDLAEESDYSLFSDNDCRQTWNKIGVDIYPRNDTDERTDAAYLNDDNSSTHDTDARNSDQSQATLSFIDVAHKNIEQTYPDVPSAVNPALKFDIHRISTADSVNADTNMFCNDKSGRQPVLYEQCCDFVNTDTTFDQCMDIPLPLSQSRIEEKCETIYQSMPEFQEFTRTVDKYLKVYTHKKRRNFSGRLENRLVKLTENSPELANNNCIDLKDEPSRNETELESEYILGLGPKIVENISDLTSSDTSEESVVSTASVDIDTTVNFNNKHARQMKEIFTNEQLDPTIFRSNSIQCPPTLRRSVRLSQHENDDSTNDKTLQDMERRRDMRKSSMTIKRRNKDSDYSESDENKASPLSSVAKCSDPRRSLRSNSKFIARRSKSHLSLSKDINRSEEKVIANGKLKPDKLQIIKPEPGEKFSNKFNTIATVSRVLWGDMSDCLENSENNIEDYMDYSPSKEIPFAVGLLPLRAALERMQATPDYQPRKTRSSVMLFRQEFNGVKRKSCGGSSADSNNGSAKRQNTQSPGDNLNSNTVCHVRITASHSQPVVRPRRKSLNEEVAARTNIASRQ
ncbi:uncharacterized protein LOC124181308 isoform X1 [Neodiprion fabricii]|uniref:uncharacterized protein LOC124181308 isoform X1 n=1 Tax=Neodiprion fabricii TaxID=2872261 RepID=UPI001ED97720|nr:uncharacterized protein LOC124181308 isoform X1 [Neodiprion fabricii]XP_046423700.1 uncharacterized protein LOC124181308 isoform X1 [Neodiprion fabricii]XP_046423701.1 uncharacterized protein LOC124181308 isoform X1 [Neodiprion fabricii]XP_046423702.1 uncharacterized protein LOC124181308 isoform X1 [Neodiprion fabricii]XP_046423703.1 uncharacterized protein LOC124181308 isoform X1 [Neodiprion fabricii]